jgi:hypothetical protein
MLKPSVQAVRRCRTCRAAAARARATNNAMLGDTKYAIQAAHAAGIPAISLCWGASEIDFARLRGAFETPLEFAAALETRLRQIIATAKVPATQMSILPGQYPVKFASVSTPHRSPFITKFDVF